MTENSQSEKAFHREAYLRSQDTWRVINPSDTDYIVYFDRKGPTPVKWVIPNKNKDVGQGKGQKDVPAYIMKLYRDHKGIEMINEMILADWDKRKGKYREDERSLKEEQLALKTNNPELWEKVVPLLVKGIYSRFGGDDIIEAVEQEPTEKPGLSPGEAAMNKLGLSDRDYDVETAKDTFIQDIT